MTGGGRSTHILKVEIPQFKNTPLQEQSPEVRMCSGQSAEVFIKAKLLKTSMYWVAEIYYSEHVKQPPQEGIVWWPRSGLKAMISLLCLITKQNKLKCQKRRCF